MRPDNELPCWEESDQPRGEGVNHEISPFTTHWIDLTRLVDAKIASMMEEGMSSVS